MNHWLLKSEPGTFSVDDLARAPKRTSAWDGVRNFQARNMLRDIPAGTAVRFEPGIERPVDLVEAAGERRFA